MKQKLMRTTPSFPLLSWDKTARTGWDRWHTHRELHRSGRAWGTGGTRRGSGRRIRSHPDRGGEGKGEEVKGGGREWSEGREAGRPRSSKPNAKNGARRESALRFAARPAPPGRTRALLPPEPGDRRAAAAHNSPRRAGQRPEPGGAEGSAAPAPATDARRHGRVAGARPGQARHRAVPRAGRSPPAGGDGSGNGEAAAAPGPSRGRRWGRWRAGAWGRRALSEVKPELGPRPPHRGRDSPLRSAPGPRHRDADGHAALGTCVPGTPPVSGAGGAAQPLSGGRRVFARRSPHTPTHKHPHFPRPPPLSAVAPADAGSPGPRVPAAHGGVPREGEAGAAPPVLRRAGIQRGLCGELEGAVAAACGRGAEGGGERGREGREPRGALLRGAGGAAGWGCPRRRRWSPRALGDRRPPAEPPPPPRPMRPHRAAASAPAPRGAAAFVLPGPALRSPASRRGASEEIKNSPPSSS
ncbi:myb/SANT-like DNA-binding domain-containing protein 3 isoform X1 [Motacilla alba alba]|uniref:myb/SANT-like DNA-binding domain-containing protein 3 isoform X1 n=1 Tax=Motacilla alba alba TaxID=1094192 RepID=UPI0018D594D1|nr:myb/SANT-like DNA-binding domain-containing protein 3 isoform X1 [Motacilla alba alba]